MSIKSIGTTVGALALAAGIALGAATPASADGIKVGVLTCKVGPGIGMIIGSSKKLSCDFQPSAGKHEHYSGRINKIGLDIGFTAGGVLVWGVFAPTNGYSKHALAGSYAGASAEASLVAGVGANALVGGSGRSFTLQPFSGQVNAGVNLAAGVAGINLYASK